MNLQVSKFAPNVLLLAGNKISFDQEIVETVTLKDRVIVLLEPGDFPEDDPEGGRNVFAYDATGNLLWRI